MMERVFEIKGARDADLLEWEVLMEQGKLTAKAKSKVLTAFFAHASRGKTVRPARLRERRQSFPGRR